MCSVNKPSLRFGVFAIAAGTLVAILLSGCIADTAEDSDLPWSSNQNWEGMGPLPAMMLDRND